MFKTTIIYFHVNSPKPHRAKELQALQSCRLPTPEITQYVQLQTLSLLASRTVMNDMVDIFYVYYRTAIPKLENTAAHLKIQKSSGAHPTLKSPI